jgi:hypothetical protein
VTLARVEYPARPFFGAELLPDQTWGPVPTLHLCVFKTKRGGHDARPVVRLKLAQTTVKLIMSAVPAVPVPLVPV